MGELTLAELERKAGLIEQWLDNARNDPEREGHTAFRLVNGLWQNFQEYGLGSRPEKPNARIPDEFRAKVQGLIDSASKKLAANDDTSAVEEMQKAFAEIKPLCRVK